MRTKNQLENVFYFKNKAQWRKWLKKNYNKKENGIWLVINKKNTKTQGILYEDAILQALCFGWIDSTVRKLDSQRFIQRYTPRRKNSIWSKINKERVEKLIELGKMEKPGLKEVEKAKKQRKWKTAYTSKKKLRTPSDLKKALIKNKKVWENFKNFANSYQNMYIGWVVGAKTKQTRQKRIKKVVLKAKQNKKLITM